MCLDPNMYGSLSGGIPLATCVSVRAERMQFQRSYGALCEHTPTKECTIMSSIV